MKRLLFCGLLLIGGTSFATKDSIKIAAALDDCHLEKSVPAAADYYSNNSGTLYYGKYDATYDSMAVGLRFLSVPIASGSTIDSEIQDFGRDQ